MCKFEFVTLLRRREEKGHPKYPDPMTYPGMSKLREMERETFEGNFIERICSNWQFWREKYLRDYHGFFELFYDSYPLVEEDEDDEEWYEGFEKFANIDLENMEFTYWEKLCLGAYKKLGVDLIRLLASITVLFVDLDEEDMTFVDLVHFGNMLLRTGIFHSEEGVKSKNHNGETALMKASEMGHLEIVKVLLSAGADPTITDNYGETALMKASSNQVTFGRNTDTYRAFIAICEILVSKGADVNAKNNDGYTPLMKASGMGGRFETVQFLVLNGADVNAKSNNGYTALGIAQEWHRKRIVDYLSTLMLMNEEPLDWFLDGTSEDDLFVY